MLWNDDVMVRWWSSYVVMSGCVKMSRCTRMCQDVSTRYVKMCQDMTTCVRIWCQDVVHIQYSNTVHKFRKLLNKILNNLIPCRSWQYLQYLYYCMVDHMFIQYLYAWSDNVVALIRQCGCTHTESRQSQYSTCTVCIVTQNYMYINMYVSGCVTTFVRTCQDLSC